MQGKYDVVLVCGIGGSYLGARAALEMIKGLYPEDGIEVIFIGNTFSHTYLSQVLNHIKDKEVVLSYNHTNYPSVLLKPETHHTVVLHRLAS